MGRKFVMGDIHGNEKALKQCLERSGFDNEKDTLIQIGDVCDGFPYVCECIEMLLKIRNLIPIEGNHDDWWHTFLNIGAHPQEFRQGGLGTKESYERYGELHHMAEKHRAFFEKQIPYYIDGDKCFVHGGFDRGLPIKGQRKHVYLWDRNLFQEAMSFEAMLRGSSVNAKFKTVDNFKKIFIGHTATTIWGQTTPIFAADLINVDTGAGWEGKLTIMDVNTLKYWQSDLCKELYPEITPRKY